MHVKLFHSALEICSITYFKESHYTHVFIYLHIMNVAVRSPYPHHLVCHSAHIEVWRQLSQIKLRASDLTAEASGQPIKLFLSICLLIWGGGTHMSQHSCGGQSTIWGSPAHLSAEPSCWFSITVFPGPVSIFFLDYSTLSVCPHLFFFSFWPLSGFYPLCFQKFPDTHVLLGS